MGTDVRRLIIVDIEATCWKTKEEQGSLPNEIIEIGAVELDMKSGNITNQTSIIVKPRTTKVTPFCTELTGWTQADMDSGMDIVEALVEFDKIFQPSEYGVWASFGEYDRWKLSSTHRAGVGKLYGIRHDTNPFEKMRSHLNIKTLHALRFKLSKEMGMDRALSQVGETLEGRHHNGADDAYNIAKIARKVFS